MQRAKNGRSNKRPAVQEDDESPVGDQSPVNDDSARVKSEFKFMSISSVLNHVGDNEHFIDQEQVHHHTPNKKTVQVLPFNYLKTPKVNENQNMVYPHT